MYVKGFNLTENQLKGQMVYHKAARFGTQVRPVLLSSFSARQFSNPLTFALFAISCFFPVFLYKMLELIPFKPLNENAAITENNTAFIIQLIDEFYFKSK